MHEIDCPNCQHRLKYQDKFAGKEVRCPKCRHRMQIPDLDDSQSENVPVSQEAARGALLAHMLNSYAEQAHAAHPTDESAATNDVIEKMEYLATGSICQTCYQPAPTRSVAFHEQIGMILAFQHRSIKGRLCRKCADQYFTEFTFTTFFLGWWSLLSFVVTPFILVYNFVRYVPCLFLKYGSQRAPASQLKNVVAVVLAAAPLIMLIVMPLLVMLFEQVGK
ncbi:MAG: hypothetical protein JWM11_5572 [Planctomycetaceae bacterium]|nr:hypothetical protein [Planctomycetaceae bacterium]